MRAPDFWQAGRGGLWAAALSPLGMLYGRITAFRAKAPARWTAPVPVICVGNIVMGGAGKTQVVSAFRQILETHGRKPHIIMRGYGGKLSGPVAVDPRQHDAGDVGDEALMLAADGPVWIGADRTESARMAVQDGADIIIMDDGLQNPALSKTLSVIVLDGTYGLGNGHPFPAGPLREPLTDALSRAQAVVMIGEAGPELLNALGDMPRFAAKTVPAPDAPDLKGRDVIAFAGIGRPEKFFETLKANGAHLIDQMAFADHQPVGSADLTRLRERARASNAMLVTTQKDFVRLPPDGRDEVVPFPVRLVWDDPAGMASFLIERGAGT